MVVPKSVTKRREDGWYLFSMKKRSSGGQGGFPSQLSRKGKGDSL